MKLTERRRRCQHCAKDRATWSLTWEDDDGETWSEDWCDGCTAHATEVLSAVRLWLDHSISPEICRT